jgi:hypothetical protein
MSTLDFVELKLDEAGISYKTNLEENGEKKKLITFWKSSNNVNIKILLFLGKNSEWINLGTKIGNIGNFKTNSNKSVESTLLRLNNIVIGSKFTLDKFENIYCNAELHSISLNSETLRRILRQIVHSISLFNKETSKKKD